MIKPEIMDAHKVSFFDPRAPHISDAQKFWRVVSGAAPAWVCENVLTEARQIFDEEDLPHLEPIAETVFSDTDLRPLLGKRVHVSMTSGSTLTGTVRGVSARTIDVLGVPVSLPTEVKLDGDVFGFELINAITLA